MSEEEKVPMWVYFMYGIISIIIGIVFVFIGSYLQGLVGGRLGAIIDLIRPFGSLMIVFGPIVFWIIYPISEIIKRRKVKR